MAFAFLIEEMTILEEVGWTQQCFLFILTILPEIVLQRGPRVELETIGYIDGLVRHKVVGRSRDQARDSGRSLDLGGLDS